MRALSESVELKEYPPRAPPFGSRTFISLCNLLNWAVCGYPLPSTLSRQSAYLGSTHLLASLSDPPSPHPLRRDLSGKRLFMIRIVQRICRRECGTAS